jgi:hypothetical protein
MKWQFPLHNQEGDKMDEFHPNADAQAGFYPGRPRYGLLPSLSLFENSAPIEISWIA